MDKELIETMIVYKESWRDIPDELRGFSKFVWYKLKLKINTVLTFK